MEYDGLIVDNTPVADVFSVTLRKGQGVLRRGSVLAISSADRAMVLLGTDPVTGETLTANCILSDYTDTGTADDVHGIAYRTGHFNRNGVITAATTTLGADDEEHLRKGGILLSDALPY
jgi:hypothetical protein